MHCLQMGPQLIISRIIHINYSNFIKAPLLCQYTLTKIFNSHEMSIRTIQYNNTISSMDNFSFGGQGILANLQRKYQFWFAWVNSIWIFLLTIFCKGLFFTCFTSALLLGSVHILHNYPIPSPGWSAQLVKICHYQKL